MRRALAAAALLAALAVAAAGCGGDDPDADAAAGGLEPDAAAAGLSAQALGTQGTALAPAGITVVGTGSVTVAPDTAEWSFGVQTSADTAEAALGANSEAIDRVIAALKDAGIARDDLQTEQVSVYPRTSDDGLSIVGYDASNTVSATIRELGRAGGIVDAAVAAGANQVYGPSLTVSDSDAQYRAAVDEAFDDARRRAEAIAEKAGVTLGAPLAIVEGAGGGAMPHSAETLSDEAAADVPVEPGTQDVGASLTVTFAIG
ncbi:MAG: SIMPL domain-containing protein [Gaiellaceae bacterium]